MVLLTATAVAGSYHTDAEINSVNKVAATAVALGVVTFHDPADDTFKIAPTTGAGRAPFGVTVNKPALAADTKMDVALSGHVIVTADGPIAPGNYVMASTTTAGEVIEYVATGAPTAATATSEFRIIVGRYIGKAADNERTGVVVTSAADGDKIWVKLGPGGGGF
jgi:hypothetical protein